MDASDDTLETTPAGRTPGKYIVVILGVLLAVFLGVSIYLAMTLQPAADRFHNPTPSAK